MAGIVDYKSLKVVEVATGEAGENVLNHNFRTIADSLESLNTDIGLVYSGDNSILGNNTFQGNNAFNGELSVNNTATFTGGIITNQISNGNDPISISSNIDLTGGGTISNSDSGSITIDCDLNVNAGFTVSGYTPLYDANNLLDVQDKAQARTNLGLGSAATSSASAFATASHTHTIGSITNLQSTLNAKYNTGDPLTMTDADSHLTMSGADITQFQNLAFGTNQQPILSKASDTKINVRASGNAAATINVDSVELNRLGTQTLNGLLRTNGGTGSLSVDQTSYLSNASAFRVVNYISGNGSTISNTSTETSFSDTYTFAANSLSTNDLIRIKAKGYFSTTISTPTLTMRLKLGSATLATWPAGIAMGVAASNRSWVGDCDLIVKGTGTAGSVNTQGIVQLSQSSTSQLPFGSWSNTADTTIDTTSNQVLSVSVLWSTANTGNSITLKQLTIEKAGS